ncbi:MAG: M20 family metallo-hydrolase [Oscillospiraceae bacterium]|nr:M20 family metallo-hydrolase [Oscillospiraceae bacterium]
MADAKRIQRDLEALRDFSAPGGEGTTRLSYTPAFRKAADYVLEQMRACALEAREDGVGNLYGLRRGLDPAAPKILSGSHLDTVRCSGYFDGQAGIVCALEVARMLEENGVRLRRGFEAVATVMEEGARFKNLGGSKLAMGVWGEAELDGMQDDDGITLREALRAYGLSGNLACVCRRDEPVRAFLEVHMEQGSRLEREGIDLGVVEKIFGCRWFTLTVKGVTAHPSTPMDQRRDAALASVSLISHMARITAEQYAGRATLTVGRMSLYPGEINAIPSRAVFSMDFRSGQESCFEELDGILERECRRTEQEYGVQAQCELYTYTPPTPCAREIVTALEAAAEKSGSSALRMDSGAGHDAMIFALGWPVGMLFLPSRRGLTHCKEEWTDYENVARGADALYKAVLALDRE